MKYTLTMPTTARGRNGREHKSIILGRRNLHAGSFLHEPSEDLAGKLLVRKAGEGPKNNHRKASMWGKKSAVAATRCLRAGISASRELRTLR
jgi:hypothetical protein